jgi:hypothetical protein
MSAHKNDIRSALSQVTGITGASRGEIPAATRTALALQLVLEQDRSQYMPFIKSFHQLILDFMMGCFGIAAENFSENDPRIIKVEGTTGSSRKFHGSLVPNPLDAYLEDTNPLGWTAAGRTETVLNLVDRGVVKDPNRILEMVKLHNPDPAYEFININKQTQAKENELLRKGDFVEIGPEDDDATHLDELVKIVASFSFRSLAPAVRDAFLDHVRQHKERASMQAAPQAQPGGGVGGAAPGQAQELAGQLQAPEPGQNMEKLLGS